MALLKISEVERGTSMLVSTVKDHNSINIRKVEHEGKGFTRGTLEMCKFMNIWDGLSRLN